jgi:hypothetical protein
MSQININKIVSDTLIAVTQVITQGAEAYQLISVNCTDNQTLCTECVSRWATLYKKEGLDPKAMQIQETCKYVCNCEVNDVNLSQQIVCDFSAYQDNVSSQEFFDSFMSNLYLESYSNNVSLPGLGLESNMEILQKQVSSIFSKLQQDSVQESLQALKTVQLIDLTGAGSVTGVNMTQMVTMVSSVLQTNETIIKEINTLESILLSLTTQITMAGIEQLITSILMIFAVIIILIVMYFIAQNLIQMIPALMIN